MRNIPFDSDVCVDLLFSHWVVSNLFRMDSSPPDSSVHGISQASKLEWADISFSRGSFFGFPGSSVAKNPPAKAGDTGDVGSVPGSGRSHGGGNGNPLQYSCLENSMDRGAWWAILKSWTQLSNWAHLCRFTRETLRDWRMQDENRVHELVECLKEWE